MTDALPSDLPLLFVRPRLDGARSTLTSGMPPRTTGPGPERQQTRISPRFTALRAAMASNTLTIADDIAGHDPELVVVFDVAGPMDAFARAASQVPGLEFLVEIAEEPAVAPDGFETTDQRGLINPTLYVLAQNAAALAQILGMWNRWRGNPSVKLDRGLNPWKQVFALLTDIRAWGPFDRIRDTAIAQFWEPALDAGAIMLRAEVELWFRGSAILRDAAHRELAEQVRLAGGRVLDSAQIESIAYHALLVELPAGVARQTLTGTSFLVMNPRVSHVRPQTLAAEQVPASDPMDAAGAVDEPNPSDGPPLVAVLDALPLLGHVRLRRRLLLDDPNDLDATVSVRARGHGSMVCSLVVWGDLARPSEPLRRRILVHPLLSATSSADGGERDAMDNDVLPVRLMRDVLDRLLVGTRSTPPVAPSVRVIVLAVGHTAIPFGNTLSPWARLLDVYANRHNVLFVVSAGNHDLPIDLGPQVPVDTIEDPAALHAAVRRHLLEHAHERRILSPSDSVNSLTVGALHQDASAADTLEHALDLIADSHLPSPISGLGGGYRRQMKPEIFADGGRVLYRLRWDVEDRLIFDRAADPRATTGLLAAVPGQPGDIAAEWWSQGTSAATGFLGHAAGQVAELLAEDNLVYPRFLGVATKALLLNSASWNGAERVIAGARGLTHGGDIRKEASRLLGFGALRPDRVAIGAPHRVTVVGTGTLHGEDAMLMELPVPPSLNGRAELRRVSVTATWFTPVNARNLTYRQARVWFELTNAGQFALKSVQGESTAVRRGAAQHEVLEGERAVTVAPNAVLAIRINCARTAGMGMQPVPIAVVGTFEVAPGSTVRVYDEVRAGLQARANVRTSRIRTR